ncbi:MAG: hypothetical protein HMLIMOIP_000250 [Candidatus Nitrosomirales archaeon]|jgi:hypothetical protein
MVNTTNKTGIGTWLYPPVWISNINSSEFLSRFPPNDEPIQESGRVVLKDACEKIPILVREDGFVAVGTRDIKFAIEFYNTFVACAILKDLVLYSIEESELIDFHSIDIEHSKIGEESLIGTHVIFHTPRSLLHDRRIATNKLLRANGLELVSTRKAGEIMKTVEKCFHNKPIRTMSRLVAQSFTHFDLAEYSASFMLAWTVIENRIGEEWKAMVNDRGIAGDRKKDLLGINWHVSHKLQTMNLAGLLGDTKFDLLDKLRNKRNRFVHYMEPVEKPTALNCLNLSLSILKQIIQDVDDAQQQR